MSEFDEKDYGTSENAVPEPEQSVDETQQSRSTEQQAGQSREAEQQAWQSREAEQQAGQSRGAEQQAGQSRGAEQQAGQSRNAEQQAGQSRNAEQQTYGWQQNQGQPYGQYRQNGQNGQNSQNSGQPQGGWYRNGTRQNDQSYQQSWNGQPHYNYYQRQQAPQQNAQQTGKGKKSSGKGSKWAVVVAMALVFGLIAGTVSFGVNRAANALFPANTQATSEASAGTEEKQETHLSVTGTDSEGAAQGQTVVGGTKTVAQVASEAMPALVTISTMSVQEMRSFFGTQKYEAEGAGTGVIVGENDTELLVATNNHVVEGAREVSVGFIDETVAEAQIKGTDSNNDLAIVAVKLEDIPEETRSQIKIAAIGDSDALALGDQVVAIGNALGVGQSVTSGYVSALDRELDLSDGYNDFTSSGLIQTDAAINSGNSGGALLNMKGEVIGINEAKSAYTASGVTVDNVGYAIPMSKAQPILEELMNQETREKYSEDEQGYLGVSLVNVSSDFAMLYGVPEGVGFAEVAEGSPAAQGGAMKGDILTEFNGKEISSVDEMMEEIRYYRSGEEVELTVYRADSGEYKELKLTVTLGDKDAISSLQTE